jgi:ABC-type dipeptide/oligopeptide/nickel transport system permease component
MLQAINNRDVPTVQALSMIFALLVMMITLGADLLRAGLDPRVELL